MRMIRRQASTGLMTSNLNGGGRAGSEMRFAPAADSPCFHRLVPREEQLAYRLFKPDKALRGESPCSISGPRKINRFATFDDKLHSGLQGGSPMGRGTPGVIFAKGDRITFSGRRSDWLRRGTNSSSRSLGIPNSYGNIDSLRRTEKLWRDCPDQGPTQKIYMSFQPQVANRRRPNPVLPQGTECLRIRLVPRTGICFSATLFA